MPGSRDPGVHSQGSAVVQAETGLHVRVEATVEGVQVLLQVSVEERQSPPLVVQSQPDPQRVHRDPQVRAPAVVQELVFVP